MAKGVLQPEGKGASVDAQTSVVKDKEETGHVTDCTSRRRAGGGLPVLLCLEVASGRRSPPRTRLLLCLHGAATHALTADGVVVGTGGTVRRDIVHACAAVLPFVPA